MNRILVLDANDDSTPFPPASAALEYPNGLIAMGGPLSITRLRMAYERGIFPWFSEGQPPLWWTPDPRAVLFPGTMHIARSLKKRLRQGHFSTTLDHDFRAVVHHCAEMRANAEGTWITPQMKSAYQALHEAGMAHSIEVWSGSELAGGLYGVAIGGAFFGESMFSRHTDASKVALAWLNAQLLRWGYDLIDCQVSSPHLLRLGAQEIPRRAFLQRLRTALDRPGKAGFWAMDRDLDVNEVVGG